MYFYTKFSPQIYDFGSYKMKGSGGSEDAEEGDDAPVKESARDIVDGWRKKLEAAWSGCGAPDFDFTMPASDTSGALHGYDFEFYYQYLHNPVVHTIFQSQGIFLF